MDDRVVSIIGVNMIEYIKRIFCKHGDMQIISDREWVNPSSFAGFCETIYEKDRKYLVCTKCGYKRKISNK